MVSAAGTVVSSAVLPMVAECRNTSVCGALAVSLAASDALDPGSGTNVASPKATRRFRPVSAVRSAGSSSCGRPSAVASPTGSVGTIANAVC